MNLHEAVKEARSSGKLLPAAADHVAAFLDAGLPSWAQESLAELLRGGQWDELNDRFFRYLEFGTGGMRGRTIGRVTTAAEKGTGSEPAHAGIGSNLLNDFTLIRAVAGLHRYTERHLEATGRKGPAKLVIAHDVRFFSRHFCELAAAVWGRLGGKAFIFDGPRSTPQLSFSVRWLQAHAGVVITASHNPPHDNGFKAYFEDGGQVVPPHDKGIVGEVNAVPLRRIVELAASPGPAGAEVLGRAADDAYLAVATKAVIDHEAGAKARLKVAFTNIHGTGGLASVPLLLHAKCRVSEVPEQLNFDPRFPTVKSPNPENAEALALAVKLAEERDCELVMGTDPDADRMGVAVRNRDGKLEFLTGNQIGSVLADYRLARYKELGWIPAKGSDRAALIKTFVTTQLQDAIGRYHGVKVINTLTGFKWIAAKIRGYEDQLKKAMGPGFAYDDTPFAERAKLLMQHSTFYVFGGEESYGYLGNDFVRDKDANAACLMFAEACAWLKNRGLTVPEYLDEIYLRCGFYWETVINLYYEGASGNAKIARILESYRSRPPKEFAAVAVTKFEDFGRQDIRDADGELIPKQDLYFVTLANGCSFAARGSGTEPKMKFYLFGQAKAAKPGDLPSVKASVRAELDRIKAAVEADARLRAEG